MGRTAEKISETITAANDSIHVIENIIEKITNGESATDDLKNDPMAPRMWGWNEEKTLTNGYIYLIFAY
jgi:hypothetical protein